MRPLQPWGAPGECRQLLKSKHTESPSHATHRRHAKNRAMRTHHSHLISVLALGAALLASLSAQAADAIVPLRELAATLARHAPGEEGDR